MLTVMAEIEKQDEIPKVARWREFSRIVRGHVLNYTVAQYGPEVGKSDDVQSVEDCRKYMAKYQLRAGSGRRGRLEELRDLVKIAHFAQFAFDFMEPTPEELAAIREGRGL